MMVNVNVCYRGIYARWHGWNQEN